MGELRERIIKDLIVRRDKVLNGGINCIPLPFARFRADLPGIEQGKYYLVSAATKGGKTQLTNYLFVINTIFWCYKNPGIIIPKIFYFPLEETPEAITLRFMSFVIHYLTKGEVTISPSDLKSTDERKPLPPDVVEIMESEEFIKLMNYYEEVVTFYDDKNVTGIHKVVKNYALENGESFYKEIVVREPDELGRIQEVTKKKFDYYVPNRPNEYVMFIVDHVSLLTPEKGTDLRESINELSKICVTMRNRYNYIPVIVQQQSTETISLEAFKNNKIRPTIAGLADSKYTARDCSVMLGITNPHSFELPEYLGYDIRKLRGNIRFMEVVLARDGIANGICPMIFRGEINSFREAPLPTDMQKMNQVYEALNTARIERRTVNPAVAMIAWASKLTTKINNKWQM